MLVRENACEARILKLCDILCFIFCISISIELVRTEVMRSMREFQKRELFNCPDKRPPSLSKRSAQISMYSQPQMAELVLKRATYTK